ncbi:MAG: hypothetical protein HY965_01215 [Ignavibacteriales bacterium]|nr:hypothetical protein [Ignavibacteriales bacterium]
MRKTLLLLLFTTFFTSLLLTGCATILRGYTQEIDVLNVQSGTKITTADNVDVPLLPKYERRYNRETKKYEDSPISHYIILHRAQRQVLTISANGRQKQIELYPYLSGGYVAVDILLGFIPAFIDSQTGCWNYYDAPLDLAL